MKLVNAASKRPFIYSYEEESKKITIKVNPGDSFDVPEAVAAELLAEIEVPSRIDHRGKKHGVRMKPRYPTIKRHEKGAGI